MTLRIIATKNDVWTVSPQGRLDLPAARAIEDSLNELLDAGRGRVVVDLAEVGYVASAGLKALLTALRRARLQDGDVRLASLTTRVREVFEMAGFDQVFSIYGNVDEAIASFNTAD
jgi:anti-sigma B factor antagonist